MVQEKNIILAYNYLYGNYAEYNFDKIDPEEFLRNFFNNYDKK